MPQTNYTPILIYASGTTGNTPAAGNLTNSSGGSELAINYFDGKLFYKDASNVVQVLATKGTGTIGGSNTQVQFNSSGALAGSANFTYSSERLRLDRTTSGDVLYGTAFNANVGIFLERTGASPGSFRIIQTDAQESYFDASSASHKVIWRFNSVEQMRLTSTGLGIGTSSPTAKLHVEGNTNANSVIFFKNSNSAATAFVSLNLGNDANGLGGFKYTSSTFTGTPNALLYGGDFHVFNNIAGVERMRLDSSGNLGVGTTSPQTRLHVLAASAADVEVARFQNPFTGTGSASITIGDTGGATYRPFTIRSNWTSGPGVVFIANRDIAGRGFDFRNNADTTSLFFIESTTGNVGLGVTPSAWNVNIKALQVNANGSSSFYGFSSGSTYSVGMGVNWIFNTSSNNVYLANGFATNYYQQDGQHIWRTAPSGTAGNTISFTQAMTLDASGNLGIGTTSPTFRLEVSNPNALPVRFTRNVAGSSLGGLVLNQPNTTDGNSLVLRYSADTTGAGATTDVSFCQIEFAADIHNQATRAGSIRFTTSLGGVGDNQERLRITSTGNQIATQPAESAQNANATLTVANLQTRIITSNAAVTLTLPTGTDLDTYATSMATNTAFECTFIATTANAITIAANGNTTVGSLTVAGNTSGTFRFRKTAANTFTVYRVA